VGAMAQADVGHGVNAAFPEGKLIQGHEIRCVARTANGTCGALLRDKDGHQARDDVFFARKACVHGLCGACLVGQVLKCTSEGQVYKCPVCEHSWTSWDVRSRRVDVVASAAGGSKKRKTETFQATKQTWGQDPKRGIFAPKSVREFHAEHANSSGAGGSAGESLGACAIADTRTDLTSASDLQMFKARSSNAIGHASTASKDILLGALQSQAASEFQSPPLDFSPL